MNHELQALQNFGDKFGMKIIEHINNDKRKKRTYFASINNISVSPVLGYNELNHFLLGWNKAASIIK